MPFIQAINIQYRCYYGKKSCKSVAFEAANAVEAEARATYETGEKITRVAKEYNSRPIFVSAEILKYITDGDTLKRINRATIIELDKRIHA